MKGSFLSPQDRSQHLGVCLLVPHSFPRPKNCSRLKIARAQRNPFSRPRLVLLAEGIVSSQDCSFAEKANRPSQLPTIVQQLFLPQESFSPPEELLSPQDLLSMRSLILLDSPCRKNHSCCLEIARSQKKSPGGTAAAYACGGASLAQGIGFLF